MKLNKYFILGGILASMGLTSCVGDLNVEPQDETKKMELTSKEEYLQDMAGCYYSLCREGGINTAATGGEGIYSRVLFNLEELCTDEVIIAENWNDAGVEDLCFAIPASDNHWIEDALARFLAHITICNQFIKDISGAGEFFSDAEIAEMKAEIRVLRDLAYYNIIDLWGRGPWTDENSLIGATPPTYDRQQLFDAILNDLLDAVPQVTPAAQQEYGRISREAGYALLAKMYLNADVYVGQPMWQQCADACQNIINSGLALCPDYKYLFCATNERHVACQEFGVNNEIIWTLPQNSNTLRNWGGTTYLSVGAYASTTPDEMLVQLGCGGGPWSGPHMRPETVNNFTDPNDQRAMFYEGNGLFINDISDISDWGRSSIVNPGLMCIKWTYTSEDDYYNTAGEVQPDENSCDFIIFRLADIYLMMVECEINGANVSGGSLQYLQAVQKRAGIADANVSTSLPSKRQLLDERNRELYWESHRRSDMIRLGFYTGDTYNWLWKGGVYEGTSLPETRKLMPMCVTYVPTLGQNPGY